MSRLKDPGASMLDATAKKKLQTRLKRIEGQLAAISRMVEDDTYCVDVLLQMAAAQGALGKAGHVLLGHHIETCVRDACLHGDDEERQRKVKELMDVFARYGGLRR